MKTKTRTAQLSLPGSAKRTGYYTPNGGIAFQTGNSGDISKNVLDESITYDLPFGKSFGTCLHVRSSFQIPPNDSTASIRFNSSPQSAVYTVITDPWFWARYYEAAITPRNAVVRPTSWKALSATAMDELMPTFSEGGESIVNFILELKSLRNLVQIWNKSRNFLQNVANGHLSYSFGWKPFISDVIRLRDALDKFRKKLRQLQEESGKPQKRRFRRYTDLVELPVGSIWTDPNQHRLEFRWIEKPRYCATCEFTYIMPDMRLLSNQIKGFLDTLGVQFNPSIPWNAIPYSFVIDWFFNVGSWLHSLRSDNLKIPATVTDFCHSLKYEMSAIHHLNPRNPGNTAFIGEMTLYEYQILHYERRRDIPSYGLFDKTVKTPDWSKLLLGGSLLVQRT